MKPELIWFCASHLTVILVNLGEVVIAEETAPVNDLRVYCVTDVSSVNLQCLQDQIVVVRRAVYYKSKVPGCWTGHEDRCQVSDVGQELLEKCYRLTRTLCTLDVGEPAGGNDCRGYSGTVYLEVEYNCQPAMGETYHENVRNMCDMPQPWSGTLLYLWNDGFPHFATNQDCGCDVTVHEQTEVNIHIPIFIGPTLTKAGQSASDCTPRVTIGNSTFQKTICAEDRDYISQLDVSVKSGWYIHMRNTNQEQVLFWLVFQVHHLHNITVSCRTDFQPPARLSPPTSDGMTSPASISGSGSPSVQSSTTKSPATKVASLKSEHGHWPMITGIVATVAVLLLVGTILLLFFRKKQRLHLAKVFSLRDTNRNVFENNTYVTHEEILQNRLNATPHGGAGALAALPPDPPPYRDSPDTKINLFPMGPEVCVTDPSNGDQPPPAEANNGIAYSSAEKNHVITEAVAPVQEGSAGVKVTPSQPK